MNETDQQNAPAEEPQHDIETPSPAAEDDEQNVSDQANEDLPAHVAAELEELRRNRDEMNDRIARVSAEFQNFRRRSESQLEDQVRLRMEGLLGDLVHVLDAMDAAFGATASSLGHDKAAVAVLEGFEQIRALLGNILERAGLQRIESLGQVYDPRLHEVLMNIPSDEHPTDTVLAELRAGYTILDRVLRPSQVSVSSGPADPPQDTASSEESS